MKFESVADELYGAAREEFIALRDERAAEAKAAGRQQLATKIRGLRKPTTAAWLANQLARQRAAEIGRLEQLGEALRRAHTELAGEELRNLSRQRHELIEALTDEARAVGRELGTPVSDAVAQELAETLETALGDPGAARTLAQGRLTSSLHPGEGLSERWLSAATAAPRRTATQRPPAARPYGSKPAPTKRPQDDRAAQVKEDRQREKEAQRAEAARLRAAREKARKTVREAKKARDDASKRLREAERAEEKARRATEAARADAEKTEQALAEAETNLAGLD
ncbi:hypothetical protein SAMN05216266_101148 [Amycolatopsis marina]|uniref:Uncharacterized protein n=1 Tax=Amycolatopsis marina TaxID=490629 RepID=A0A1I0VBY7_9PSEU|nr:hypothetical protein [Amycolatopsis marina]SFA73855.1 hypothetical protein SAMN05216266_101148 [Amycolatopsis marina]